MAKKKTTRKKTATKKRTATTPPAPTAADKRRATTLYKKLAAAHPDAHCALDHRNAFELLVATILSAQCTDERVNMTTPALFKAFPTPAAMAKTTPAKIEPYVKSCGFFRNKAKAIHGAAVAITDEFGGQVPDEMDALLTLPGVARKTANVVLGNAYGKNEGVVVDTHVQRLSNRLGFTAHTDPKKIEQDLMALFARPKWTMLSHLLIFHGRRFCKARKPDCDGCPLGKHCCNDG